MLEGLDEVPWGSLRDGYGSTDDVARQLRALVADGDAATEAIDRLSSTLVHQGDIYGATLHAVPFLVDMFRASQSSVRVQVGHLLRSIAEGSSPKGVDVTVAIHDAVAAGLDAYLEVLQDPGAPRSVRATAANVCGGCRRARDRAAAASPATIGLLDPLTLAEDQDVREAAIRVLGSFDPTPAVADLFAAALARYPDDILALLALARCRDDRAVAPLLAAIEAGDPARQIWLLPFVGPFAPELLPTLVAQMRADEEEAEPFGGGAWTSQLGVQEARIQAIARFGEVAAQHGAVELCRDLVARGGRRQQLALATLAAIGPPASAALDVVQELADSAPPPWKVEALRPLWSISHDPARVIGPLTAIVEDGDNVISVGALLLEVAEHLTHLLPRLRELAASERLNAQTRQVVEQVIRAVEAAGAPPPA